MGSISRLRGLVLFLFLLYLAALAKLVLVKNCLSAITLEVMTVEGLLFRLQYAANFIPTKTIAYYLSGRPNLPVVIENIGGNLLLFSPLGFLVPFLSAGAAGARRIAVIAFGISLVLELSQLFIGLGSFDVDDLLLNVLGGMAGFLLFKGVYRLFPATVSQWMGLDSEASS